MKYSNQLINEISVDNILSSKEEKIHLELFNNALAKLKQEKSYNDEEYLFIEVRNSTDYLEPSKVLVIHKIYPYKKTTEDLKDYWGKYNFVKQYERIDTEDESLEIIDMIYTSGKAIVVNKYTGEKFKLDFDKCKNIPYSEDWYRYKGEINSFETNI